MTKEDPKDEEAKGAKDKAKKEEAKEEDKAQAKPKEAPSKASEGKKAVEAKDEEPKAKGKEKAKPKKEKEPVAKSDAPPEKPQEGAAKEEAVKEGADPKEGDAGGKGEGEGKPKPAAPQGAPGARGFRDSFSEQEELWVPRTALGKMVSNGQLTSMREVMEYPAPIKEVQIVDRLLPEMREEILDVGRVQRVTDSGRRMRFRIVAAVGNGDGYVGVSESKGKEAGPTIRKAIERAKLNIKEVKRGCSSWECGCGAPHTVPFKVTGKSGSVIVTLKPAPRGVGITSGELSKHILSLAGIKDVWVSTEGHSRTGLNFAHAVINALENTNYVKLKEGDEECLRIIRGQAKKPEQQEEEQ